MERASNLDESVLVGDGGQSWSKAQHRNQQRQSRSHGRDNNHHDHRHNDNHHHNNTAPTQLQQEQSQLLNKQQRNRLKRQKKKTRSHNDRDTASTANAAAETANQRSDHSSRSGFLYTRTHDAPQSHPNRHPFTKHTSPHRQHQHQHHHHHPHHQQSHDSHPHDTSYVRSSNQEQLNQLSAQMFKAKLVNDMDQYEALEAQLTALRDKSIIIEHRYEASSNSATESRSRTQDHKNDNPTSDRQDLDKVDSSATTTAATTTAATTTAATTTAAALDDKGRQIELITDSKIAKQLHDLQHKKNSNKHNHDNGDIQSLLREERHQSAADQHLSLVSAKQVQKLCRLDSTDDQFDAMDAQTLAPAHDLSARKRKRELDQEEAQNARKRSRLIAQHKSSTTWLQSCMYCVENSEVHSRQLAHTVIYRGHYLYLAVPKSECLVPHEFLIVPTVHIKSFREGILNAQNIGASAEEQRRFEHELYCVQKVCCKLFKSEFECGVVFIETVRNLGKNYHALIHAYPLPFETFNLCPTYFQKSILESDVMWNSNQQLVSTSKEKPLTKAIPPFMPYFYVQFGLHDGYVHVIEDETKVKQDFGAQIIAGMVEKVLFKLKNEPFEKQVQRMESLKAVFEPVYKNKLDDKLNK